MRSILTIKITMDDLRSVLLETPDPGGGIMEDDKVGAGDLGLVLTLLTLYLLHQCQYTAVVFMQKTPTAMAEQWSKLMTNMTTKRMPKAMHI